MEEKEKTSEFFHRIYVYILGGIEQWVIWLLEDDTEMQGLI